jgi:hypothetical protein
MLDCTVLNTVGGKIEEKVCGIKQFGNFLMYGRGFPDTLVALAQGFEPSTS